MVVIFDLKSSPRYTFGNFDVRKRFERFSGDFRNCERLSVIFILKQISL